MRFSIPVLVLLLALTLALCSCGPFGVIPLLGAAAGGGGGGGGAAGPGGLPNPTLVLRDQSNSLLTDHTNSYTVDVDVTGVATSVTHYILDETTSDKPEPTDIGWQSLPIPVTHTFATTGLNTLYLWVKNDKDLVNAGVVYAEINIDLTPPADPSLTLYDQDTMSTTTTDDPTVDVDATNIDADVEKYILSETHTTTPAEDDAAWDDAPVPGTYTCSTGEALKTVYLWVKDYAGNICANPGMHQIAYNTSGVSDPIFHLEDLTSGSTQYSDSTTVAVVGDSIDVDATYYLLSESQSTQPIPTDPGWTAMPLPATMVLGGTGNRTVYLWLMDDLNGMNVTPTSAQIFVDTTIPSDPSLTLRSTLTSSTDYTNDPLVNVETANIDADASQFILSETSYATQPAEDDADWTDVPIWAQYTLSSGEGTHTVYLWVKDDSGNICANPGVHTIELDTSLNTPTLTLTDADALDSEWCNEMTVDVAIGSLDADVTNYILSETVTTTPGLGHPDWDPLMPTKHTFADGTEGTKTVYLWIMDKAGNIAGTADNIIYDVTDPTGNADVASGTYASAQTVTLSANDDRDTSPAIYFTIGGADPDTDSTPYTAPIDISTDTTLKFIVYDKAGNDSGVYQRDYTINLSPQITISSLTGIATRLTVWGTYNLSDDGGANCNITVTYFDGSNWQPATLVSTDTGTISGNVIVGASVGNGHIFGWDSVADGVGLAGPNSSVQVRVVANDGFSDSSPSASGTFTVDNRYIYVPDDFATIQAAINKAVNTQTVIVRDGTYSGSGNRDIGLGGKQITLLSENGPANCTINAGGAGYRCFYIYQGEGSNTVIQGFTITNGDITGSGGGICCASGSSPTIRGCVVTGNAASNNGGGISCHGGGTPTIDRCIVSGNASSQGGGIFCDNSSANVSNCLILNNTATGSYGGGIYCNGANTSKITNCTIVNNYAQLYGGGVAAWVASTQPWLRNCIIYGNSAGSAGDDMSVYDATITIDTCCYNAAKIAILNGGGFNIQGTNVTAEPRFVCSLVDNFRLRHNSPCVDAGDNAFVGPTDYDPDGHPRTVNGIPDIGAYEFRSVSVAGGLQMMIDAAENGDTVLVVDGTYTGPGNRRLEFNGKTIHLHSLGGPDNCTIDCDGADKAFYFNSTGETRHTTIDGFTIRNGYTSSGAGGAIGLWSTSPTIMNCVIKDCESDYAGGGGIYSNGGSPAIINCTITGNRATATAYGGGIEFLNAPDALILSCKITANTAPHGAGVRCSSSSNLTLINSLFANNTTPGTGGGVYANSTTNVQLVNCTIAGNRSGANAGGVYAYGNFDAQNCIFWGNEADGTGDEFMKPTGAVVTLDYCCYSNSSGDIAGGGSFTVSNSTTSDPRFICPTACNYALDLTSSCVDTGKASLLSPVITTDIMGRERVVDGDLDYTVEIDIGAYEAGMGVFVDDSAAAGGTGLDPADPVQTIADGVTAAQANDRERVYVAGGTYTAILDMEPGLQFYGGYNSAFTVRDFAAYESTISRTGGYGVYADSSAIGNGDCIDGFAIRISMLAAGTWIQVMHMRDGASPDITNNIIVAQDTTNANNYDYGIRLYSSSPSLYRMSICNNTIVVSKNTSYAGTYGVAFCQGGMLPESRILFEGNRVTSYGHYCNGLRVMECPDGTAIVRNNIVSARSFDSYCYGISIYNAGGYIANNTIVAYSETSIDQYGIYHYSPTGSEAIELLNNIICTRRAAGIGVNKTGAGGVLNYHHNLVFLFSSEKSASLPGSDNTYAAGDIWSDVFMGAYDSTTIDGDDSDYHLNDPGPTFYAVDMGADATATKDGGVLKDMEGTRRPQDTTHDRGAYEK